MIVAEESYQCTSKSYIKALHLQLRLDITSERRYSEIRCIVYPLAMNQSLPNLPRGIMDSRETPKKVPILNRNRQTQHRGEKEKSKVSSKGITQTDAAAVSASSRCALLAAFASSLSSAAIFMA